MKKENTQESQTPEGDRSGAGADKLCYVLESVGKENVLYLTLKKKWFDMIKDGIKKDEYREIKPYWTKRLINKNYRYILFRNGYSPIDPTILVEYIGLSTGTGFKGWGAETGKRVYRLHLGDVIYTDSCT